MKKAAGVFTLLKLQGITCELVTEFAKDLTWEERSKTLQNQFYISAKQYHRLWRIPDTVKIIITDSPIILSMLYSNDSNVNNLTLSKFHEFDNINFFLKRVKPYNPIGRKQNEDDSKELDSDTMNMLQNYDIKYRTTTGDWQGINEIVNYISLSLLSKSRCNYQIIKKELQI